jgi:Family of unknown function (DUF6600)/FecR protein
MQPAGLDQWADAVVNRPLTTGDRLWTDQNSRAELELGPLAIRLAQTTGFTFLDLNDSTVQMQVTAGTVEVHVPQLIDGQSVEIDTPTLAIAVLQSGDYRVEVNETGDSATVKVIAGGAEVSGAGQTISLYAQQQATFTEGGGLTSGVATLGSPDDFDSWVFGRNRREAEAQQAVASYVSPEVTGYEDLDQYGTWQSEPEYGYVWFPNAVPVGWAPYRSGRWIWIYPWGWTWVDAQPWGYAPFHYGRWTYLNGTWCWVPGAHGARPVYAPALVAWVGTGAAVTPALAVGPSVAWFPLAPRDLYVPPYRVSEAYLRSVNIGSTGAASDAYLSSVVANGGGNLRSVNQNVPGAVTAVPRSIFTSAQPVAPHAIRMTPTSLHNERASPTPPAIAPVRASVLGTGATAGKRARVPPARLIDRPVVALKIPPPAPPTFEKARQAIVANGGRPLAPTELARLRPNEPRRPIRSAGPSAERGPVPFTQEMHVPPAPHAERTSPQELHVPPAPHAEQTSPQELRVPPAPYAARPPPREFQIPRAAAAPPPPKAVPHGPAQQGAAPEPRRSQPPP